MPQAEGNITSVKLRLGFEAYGSAIAAITSVEVLEMGSGANPSNNQTAGQLPAAGNQPVPAANSSTSLPPLPAYNSTSNGTGSQPPPAMPAYNGSIVPPNASTGNGSEGPLLVPPPPAGTAN